MSAFRLTPAAQRDLSEIWDFTHNRWDVVQAEEYIAEIRDAIERVAKDPNRGRRCADIRDGYRRYVVGSHLVFFVEYEDAIDVIRILHQRMDPTRHM